MGFPFCKSFFPWLDERSALHRRNHRRPCLNFRAMMRSQHPYVSILCLMVSRGQSPPCDQCDKLRLSLRFRARGIAGRVFLSCDPRASDRLLGSLPPFSACCRAMRLGRGAIDDGTSSGVVPPGRGTSAATIRASPSDGTDCKSWSGAPKLPDNPASDTPPSAYERCR